MIGNYLHLEYGYNTVKKATLGVKLKNMPSGTFWHCFIENMSNFFPHADVIKFLLKVSEIYPPRFPPIS